MPATRSLAVRVTSRTRVTVSRTGKTLPTRLTPAARTRAAPCICTHQVHGKGRQQAAGRVPDGTPPNHSSRPESTTRASSQPTTPAKSCTVKHNARTGTPSLCVPPSSTRLLRHTPTAIRLAHQISCHVGIELPFCVHPIGSKEPTPCRATQSIRCQQDGTCTHLVAQPCCHAAQPLSLGQHAILRTAQQPYACCGAPQLPHRPMGPTLAHGGTLRD